MRLLSSESEVEFSKLRTGTLSSAEWPKLAQAAGMLYRAPIFIDDSPALAVLDLRARARRLKKEHGLGLLVIDYLQLMRGRSNTGGDRREQEISEISRFLKALAKELNIPVIAISQLNRMVEQRDNKRPRLSDLRESGAIEQDADVIMFIYRDEVYNKDTNLKGIAEIIIGKQRNGPTGDVQVTFLDKYTAFRNLYTRMNLPNILSLFRLCLTAFFILAISYQRYTLALVLFRGAGNKRSARWILRQDDA